MPILTPNNELIDPIMGQVVPTSATPGAQYAVDITNDLLTRIAPHRHTGANNLDGYQLDGDSFDLTQDLVFNNVNATSLRAARFISQITNLSGSQDLNELYDVNGDLWFNDGSGNQIRLTQAGSVSPSTTAIALQLAPTTLNGGGPSFPVLLGSSAFNAINCNVASQSLYIILPVISSVTNGRFYYFMDVSNNALANNIVIEVAIGSTDSFSNGQTTFTINNVGGYVGIYANPNLSPNRWEVFDQSVYDDQALTLNGSTLTLDQASFLELFGSTCYLANSSQINALTSSTINLGDSTASFNATNGSNVNINDSNLNFTTANITGSATISGGSAIRLAGAGAINANATGAITVTHFNGIESQIANGINSQVTSGIVTSAVGGIQPLIANGINDGGIAGGLQTTVPGGIVLGGGAIDWVTFGTVKSKSAVIQLMPTVLPNEITGTPSGTSSPYNGSAGWAQTTLPVGGIPCLQSPYFTDLTTNISTIEIPMPIMHQGATLSSVQLYFQIRVPSVRSPATTLQCRIYRSAVATGDVVLLGTGAIGSSGYNVAGVQNISVPISIFPVIDNSQYFYSAIIADEYGTNAVGGNYFTGLLANFTNIPNMTFPV